MTADLDGRSPAPAHSPHPSPSSASPTIQVTHRSDRSLTTRIVHTSLRAFRPLEQAGRKVLSKEEDVYPPGSPRLSPKAAWTEGCRITERQIERIYVYDLVREDSVREEEEEGEQEIGDDEVELDEGGEDGDIAHAEDLTHEEEDPSYEEDSAREGSARPYNPPISQPHTTSPSTTRRIYFIAGGSWRQPPTKEHWRFMSKLALELPHTTVSVISVPLAPRETAPTVYPRLLALYERAMADAQANGERVIWAGDSSGGNIVLGLIGEVLRVGRKSETTTTPPLPAPSALLLICPSVDAKRENPRISSIEHVDPVLDAEESQQQAMDWAGEWGLDDERVSPALNRKKRDHVVRLLKERGVRVHGVTAGHDILSPDGMVLRQLLTEEGVEGKWLEWEKMMHCFSLAWFYGLPESKEALRWILDVLRDE
ncbi:alpha/beta hydrolase fold-domain-containing protein [Schizophyllum amplum]|uniref:Alpha/beta hydrolase fold-domain-containing protein n=1 Tax=Schizophyllum amplum TaxID=97359 RepID=A0A550CEN8_9AGAR|nr:alpha/beta hydrolase fold-domain-containing protein [Auriculariopsis ampla]